jgi:hypothetical protein
METSVEAAFIKDVFKRVKLVEKNRYQKGQLIRKEVFNRIQQGEDVNNYRIEFIRDAVYKLFNLMEDLSFEFNKAHPEDRFTMNDVGDVLATALKLIKNIEA